MIRKKHRGIPHKTIIDIIRRGRRAPIEGGTVFWEYSPSGMPSRVAVLVPKKTAKTAVLRNAMRRRIQAVLAGKMGTLMPPRNIVVVWKSSNLPSLLFVNEQLVVILRKSPHKPTPRL